jgi:hypothetical protein
MAKVLSLISAPGLQPDAFREYWAGDYLQSLLAIGEVSSRIRRIVHNHVVPVGIREDSEFSAGDWSGIAETWFDTQADAQAFLSSPAIAGAVASHSKWLPKVVHLHCTELPQWGSVVEKPTLKLFAFFHPSAAMTREQSQHYWTHHHVKVASALNDPKRYVARYLQNHVVSGYHTADPAYDFAGAPELWFYSEAAAQKLFHEMDPERTAALIADEARFSDRKRTYAVITDEQPVYAS